MKRFFALAGFALVALLAVIAGRAARLESKQVEASPLSPVAVDVPALAARVSTGLRFRTISSQDEERIPAEEFEGFLRHLATSYPGAHAKLARERVARYSLLFTWQGRDPSLRPGLLMAHHDVVPAEAAGDSWTQPPFSGAIDDGFVWGRGAMDDKTSVFCILDAVEALLAEGFAPERTLLLAFGHDEELGGPRGATAVAELLRDRGVELEYVLDEGGVVVDGMFPGLERPVAVVGIAEKGSVSIRLTARAAGGHSSTPPPSTAVGILAAAIHRLEQNQMPARLEGATRTFIEYLGPELPFAYRLVAANLWLFGGLVDLAMERTPATNAMVRTTTAATIFDGGMKSNVLPARADAVVNFRILPGDTVESVTEHVRRVVDDERVEITASARTKARNPSGVSPTDVEVFRALQRTIGEIHPDAVVAPYLVVAGTDSRHFQVVSDNVYRFVPYVYGRADIARAHGRDERISLENLERGVRFYRRLIENTSGAL